MTPGSDGVADPWLLLVASARHAIGAGSVPGSPWPEPAPEPERVPWDDVLALADRHGMSAFLQRYLDEAYAGVPPEVVAERLRERVRLRTRENLRLVAALISLAPAMERSGIDVMSFKGAVLSQLLYGSPALRDYDDVDLLIRERDLEEATAFLEGRGLRPWFEVEPDQVGRLPESQYARHFGDARTGAAVDLHWGFALPSLSFGIDEAHIWEGTREVEVGGVPVRTLADPLLLLVLCVHGSKHQPIPWYRLKWIADVAGVARRLSEADWDPLVRRVRDLRLEGPFLLGILVAHRMLGTPLAPPVASRLREARGLDELAEAAITALTDVEQRPRDAERIDWDLRLLDRWQDRGRYVLHRLFVPNPKDWAAVRLPRWLAPAYWLLRPVRLGAAAVARLGIPGRRAERRA